MQLTLFIFESIGTQEIILIGIVALIILGPRRLPEMAKKAGKIMADFRSTTNEFRSTWEREVNFEEEERLLRDTLENVADTPVPRDIETRKIEPISAPKIRTIDKESFEKRAQIAEPNESGAKRTPESSSDEKKSWL